MLKLDVRKGEPVLAEKKKKEKKNDPGMGRIRLIAAAVVLLLAVVLVMKAVLFIGSISRKSKRCSKGSWLWRSGNRV